jgi:hypothetical protein
MNIKSLASIVDLTVNRKLTLQTSAMIGLSAISLSVFGSSAQAVNLVQNGGFVPTGTTVSSYIDNQTSTGVTIAGWNFPISVFGTNTTRTGYNFVVPDGAAFQTNLDANHKSPNGDLKLWGASGQTVNDPLGSGWYIASDGVYYPGTIDQTLTGLVINQQYSVTFYQAAGQQDGYVYDDGTGGPKPSTTVKYTGDTTDRWQVSFGGVTKLSTLINLDSQAPVSPWQKQTLNFTANASTQLLSFLALGTPDGQPPFALLSSVSVQAVPEPFTIIGTLVGGTAAFRLRKKLKDTSK